MTDADTPIQLEPHKAEVTSFTASGVKARRYRAWCDQHQDGYQGGKVAANKWAAKHNAAEHPEATQ
jgi:hypothetical protein